MEASNGGADGCARARWGHLTRDGPGVGARWPPSCWATGPMNELAPVSPESIPYAYSG